jgi:hypothetical protein
MSRKELSDFIRGYKDGKSLHYSYDDASVILQHTRKTLYQHLHISGEHIFKCCEKASGYDEFIELCRPIAKTDTEAWLRERNKPTGKGRTRRRFR